MPFKAGVFDGKFGAFGIMADMQSQIVVEATCRPVWKNEMFYFRIFSIEIGFTFLLLKLFIA